MTAPISATTTSSDTGSSRPVAGTATAGGNMGKNEFMKLLITQMTHQDPLNPQDSAQMASQLAQFSALEQMTNINTTLQGQAAANTALAGAVNNSSAVALLGRTVTATSNQIVGGAAGTTSVAAIVPNGGGHLSVRIMDANGTTRQTKDLGTVGGGQTSTDIGDLTRDLPVGTYTVAFDLASDTGAVTHPAALVTAKIDGIRFGANGAVVTSGSLTFPIGTIVSVQ
jgi:flagellar basal-body rod modification protein FlgD